MRNGNRVKPFCLFERTTHPAVAGFMPIMKCGLERDEDVKWSHQKRKH